MDVLKQYQWFKDNGSINNIERLKKGFKQHFKKKQLYKYGIEILFSGIGRWVHYDWVHELTLHQVSR